MAEEFLLDYFDSNIYKDNKNGIFYIIEGVGLDEQTIIDLSQKKNTRVIFLGKVSINPQDYFYQIRQYESTYDYGGWTKRLDDDTLLNWCTDWIKKGKQYKEFAEKNGFEFYDTSFEQELINLFQKYPNLDKKLLGFPNDWARFNITRLQKHQLIKKCKK